MTLGLSNTGHQQEQNGEAVHLDKGALAKVDQVVAIKLVAADDHRASRRLGGS